MRSILIKVLIVSMNNYYEKIRNAFMINQEIKTESLLDKRYGFDFPFDIFMYSMSLLTPQAYGSRLESYIIEKFNLDRVSSKDGLGDFKDSLCQNYELKISLITVTNNCLNMVQIRPWQNISGYLMIAVDLRVVPVKLYAFQLSKQQLIEELKLLNASSAHGTKKANIDNRNIELRISVKIEDEDIHFKRWIDNYLNKELSNKFVKQKDVI
jgi:hypothetical protein